MRSRDVVSAPRRFLPALLACSLILPCAARPAEYTQSVPPELVRYLSGGSEIYQDWPPGFPTFDIPDGISVIGSQHRPPSQKVLLRSAPAGDVAQRLLVEALQARGWVDMERSTVARANGFVIPASAGYAPVSLCHDDYGTLEVRGESGVENRVYLELFNRTELAWEGCEAMLEAASSRGFRRPPPPSEAMRYIPVLREPQRERRAPVGVTGSRIASVDNFVSDVANVFQTETVVATGDLDAAALNAHYAGQLREQGWRPDAQWAGELSAGGNWTREPEEGLRLTFGLRLSRLRDNVYSVEMQMSEVTE